MKKNLILSISCAIALSSVTAALAMPDQAVTPPAKTGSPNVEATTPDVGATAPAKAKETAEQPPELLTGKILQTMDSGGYTYIYIQKDSTEKVWVAVSTTPVALGTKVTFRGGMEMRDFESKSLKRKFDKIIFADGVILPEGAEKTTTAAVMPKDNNSKVPSGGSKAAVSAKDTKITVTKATGANAYTIQEIFDKSKTLNKKKVAVRGKVVKVSAGIMGRNWIHIQDGTGSQAKKNHNLVCTSDEMADVDDIVTVTGILAKDRDFGGGYKYSAIIEGAKIKK